MAKTIKFNLICDETPVRTIEDLQHNFSIEDVLAYYNNRLLHRWLEVRGYTKELEAVKAITSEDSMEIVKELIRIFEVVADEKKVEESIYMLKYLEERRELYTLYEQRKHNTARIIDDYETGYRQLVNGILENPNDVALIKANIAEIVENYAWILELNYRELFYELWEEDFLLAIMCLLMNEKSRNYYLSEKVVGKDGVVCIDLDRSEMYKDICKMLEEPEWEKLLGENLKVYTRNTDDRFNAVAYADTGSKKHPKCMVVKLSGTGRIRPMEDYGNVFELKDVNNKFPILDGIEFSSKSKSTLMYMEV